MTLLEPHPIISSDIRRMFGRSRSFLERWRRIRIGSLGTHRWSVYMASPFSRAHVCPDGFDSDPVWLLLHADSSTKAGPNGTG